MPPITHCLPLTIFGNGVLRRLRSCSHACCALWHILAGCPVALDGHRYTWRHDSILGTLRKGIEQWWIDAKQYSIKAAACARPIGFIRPGQKPRSAFSPPSPQLITAQSHLAGANDWIFLFDLPETPLMFPPQIISSSLRPDIVIYSNTLKRCILADHVLTASSLKLANNASLQREIMDAGWTCALITFEVCIGARGYVLSGLRNFLNSLGIPKQRKSSIYALCGQAALRASYTIYLHHQNSHWPDMSPLVLV